jgi:hypothetical protein
MISPAAAAASDTGSRASSAARSSANLVAQNGDRARQRLWRRPETLQRRPHRPRHRRRRHVGELLGVARLELDAVRPQRPHQLPQQERIAAGRVMTGRGELALHGPSIERAQELLDARGVERSGLQQPRQRLSADVLEHGGRGGVLGFARPNHQRDRERFDPPREVRDEEQRGLVRPVSVVDDKQQRRALGEVGGQPVEPVQDARGCRVAAVGNLEHHTRRQLGRARE